MQEKVEIVQGDITKLNVNAIVNAANNSLIGGGGVDGAIHRAAGPELLKECRQLRGCPTGEAKITKGYDLPARYVIHTVGPIWRGGMEGEPYKLASCYRNCFALVQPYHIKTIAFPSISTGVYGYPVEQSSCLALKETQQFLKQESPLQKVIFVCFLQDVYDSYLKAMKLFIREAS